MSEILIVGIIAAVAGLLSPVVGWFLNQQGISRRMKEIESLKARIDLIEKLSNSRALSPQFDNDIEKLKYREMRAVLAEIDLLSETEMARITPHGADMSRWKRAFLTYDQISLKGRILKGLFYVFTFMAFAGTIAAITVTASEEKIFAIIGGIIGGAIYLFIGLTFRRAAVRTYEADKKKASTTQVNG